MPPGPRILAFGDSLVAGFSHVGLPYHPFARSLAKSLGCAVDSVGLCGHTTAQMVRMLRHPHVVDNCDNVCCGMEYSLEQAQQNDEAYSVLMILAGNNDAALRRVCGCSRIWESGKGALQPDNLRISCCSGSAQN